MVIKGFDAWIFKKKLKFFCRLCKVDSDCGAVKNDNLAAMAINQEIETPFQEKRRNIRKNISKIMDFEKLTPETKLAYQQEKERKKQYVQRLQRVRINSKSAVPSLVIIVILK